VSLIQIRRTDLETVLALRMTLSDPPRSREEALSPGDLSEDAAHFGAYIDEQLVGVYSIGPEPLPVLDHPPAWRFRGLVVLPNFRNRAVGPALVRYQLQEIETRASPLGWSYAKRKHLAFFSAFGYCATGYTYNHPVSGETHLLGNRHTLRVIAEAMGVNYGAGEPPWLGTIGAVKSSKSAAWSAT
jgi:GNAT superfamily N-acetyltransferase